MNWFLKGASLEEKIERGGKALIFCLLIIAEIAIAASGDAIVSGVRALWVILPIEAALAVENGVKFWVLKSFKAKIVCYVLDTLLLLVLTYFSGGQLIAILYIVILSEFYVSQQKLSGSIAMGACSIVLYLAMFAVSNALKGEEVAVGQLVSGLFNDLVILVLHFLIFNFTLQVYRKNREIAQKVSELDESNAKLKKAYAELQTVTQLEERQRIAKDIHDTAGHSITTVIMQTEAAKLIVDSDPAEAKRRLTAANLQAKHALEELRESVHLLSGMNAGLSLRDELLNIIHESTDGTDITIRYDVDELTLCRAKARFLCNTLKEGISNGLRHGGATAFWFELKREEHALRFLLSDNGKGLEIGALGLGFGLSGMQQRAESFGGSVKFESEPGDGFEIHLTLPLDGEGDNP